MPTTFRARGFPHRSQRRRSARARTATRSNCVFFPSNVGGDKCSDDRSPRRSQIEIGLSPAAYDQNGQAHIGAWFIDKSAWLVAQSVVAIHFRPASLRWRAVGLGVVEAPATAL